MAAEFDKLNILKLLPRRVIKASHSAQSSVVVVYGLSIASAGMPSADDGGGTTSRFDAWARAQIVALAGEGVPYKDIIQKVRKKDGTKTNRKTIGDIVRRSANDPDWRGEDSSAGGRPRILTKTQETQVFNLVIKWRGKSVVTIAFCKQWLNFLRDVCDNTIARSLHRAGLKWMRRPAKRKLTKDHKEDRVVYCEWLKKQPASRLKLYAFTDGTTFYLARDQSQLVDKKQAALGKMVWRMANGKDGLHDDNIGPSLYAKAQGLPVKIWGFFAAGRLEYIVLPMDGAKTTNMNGTRYNILVKQKFATWRRQCFGSESPIHLVQDHEKCLWQERNKEAIKKAGLVLEESFPVNSPDLNVIENWWHRLRQRLEDNAPEGFEDRQQFLQRLRRTVTWMNDNLQDEALACIASFKRRAAEVADLGGARCRK